MVPLLKHTMGDGCPVCRLIRELAKQIQDLCVEYSQNRGLSGDDILYTLAAILGDGCTKSDPTDENRVLQTLGTYIQLVIDKCHESFDLQNAERSDRPNGPSIQAERRTEQLSLSDPRNLHRRSADLGPDLQSLMRSMRTDGKVH